MTEIGHGNIGLRTFNYVRYWINANDSRGNIAFIWNVVDHHPIITFVTLIYRRIQCIHFIKREYTFEVNGCRGIPSGLYSLFYELPSEHKNCVTRFNRQGCFVSFQLLLHDSIALGILDLLSLTVCKSIEKSRDVSAFTFGKSHLSNAILPISFSLVLGTRKMFTFKADSECKTFRPNNRSRDTSGAADWKVGVRYPVGTVFFLLHSVHTGSEAHPGSCIVETGVKVAMTWSRSLTSI